jgi:hypothetical protein
MLPDFGSGTFIEKFINAEIALQFEMSPMVERIAEAVRNSGSPSEKFVVKGSVTGAEGFGDTVGPHGAPLVVIAFEPDLEEVAELAIGGDVRGGKMRMEIEDGERSGKFVIEVAGGGSVEEEVVVDEGHGG